MERGNFVCGLKLKKACSVKNNNHEYLYVWQSTVDANQLKGKHSLNLQHLILGHMQIRT